MKKLLFVPLMLLLLGTQVSFADSTPWYQNSPSLLNIINSEADAIIADSQWKLYRYKPIFYSSFVNLNNLQETSSFGRLVAELFSTRFSKQGYKVLEIKIRIKDIVVKERIGELILSRNISDIKDSNDAQAVLSGTYSVTDEGIYINVRIISTADRSIISAESFVIPNDKKIVLDK